MSDSQNGFVAAKDETLEEKALRVCEKIISCGLAIRSGQIIAGAKMDDVKAALNDIRNEDIESYQEEENFLGGLAACVISSMKRYVESKDMQELETVVSNIVAMKTVCGWKTDAKPATYDLDYLRIKTRCYVEPEGFAKAFVDAFDIGYKSPSTPQPKTPTGVN